MSLYRLTYRASWWKTFSIDVMAGMFSHLKTPMSLFICQTFLESLPCANPCTKGWGTLEMQKWTTVSSLRSSQLRACQISKQMVQYNVLGAVLETVLTVNFCCFFLLARGSQGWSFWYFSWKLVKIPWFREQKGVGFQLVLEETKQNNKILHTRWCYCSVARTGNHS